MCKCGAEQAGTCSIVGLVATLLIIIGFAIPLGVLNSSLDPAIQCYIDLAHDDATDELRMRRTLLQLDSHNQDAKLAKHALKGALATPFWKNASQALASAFDMVDATTTNAIIALAPSFTQFVRPKSEVAVDAVNTDVLGGRQLGEAGSGEAECTNTCNTDGYCDDGGSGSTFNLCACGTDCADCGTRYDCDGSSSPPPPYEYDCCQTAEANGFTPPADEKCKACAMYDKEKAVAGVAGIMNPALLGGPLTTLILFGIGAVINFIAIRAENSGMLCGALVPMILGTIASFLSMLGYFVICIIFAVAGLWIAGFIILAFGSICNDTGSDIEKGFCTCNEGIVAWVSGMIGGLAAGGLFFLVAAILAIAVSCSSCSKRTELNKKTEGKIQLDGNANL
jgi:hypothetical protein